MICVFFQSENGLLPYLIPHSYLILSIVMNALLLSCLPHFIKSLFILDLVKQLQTKVLRSFTLFLLSFLFMLTFSVLFT